MYAMVTNKTYIVQFKKFAWSHIVQTVANPDKALLRGLLGFQRHVVLLIFWGKRHPLVIEPPCHCCRHPPVKGHDRWVRCNRVYLQGDGEGPLQEGSSPRHSTHIDITSIGLSSGVATGYFNA